MKNFNLFLKKAFLTSLILIICFLLVSFVYKHINELFAIANFQSQRVNKVNTQTGDLLYKIIAIIIVPIVEEIFYRLGLKFSVRNVTFLIIGFLYTLYLFFQPKNIDFNNPTTVLLYFGIMILSILLIWFFVKKNKLNLELIYNNNSKLIFYLSVIFFAYSHYTMHQNYENILNIILSPIILFPYILAGFLYGTIRIKFGFWYGVYVHVLWNFLVINQILSF